MALMQTTKKMYKIVGRYMDGVQVIGYQLMDSNGNSIRAKKSDVERLADEGFVENCRVIEYNGVNYIKGVGIRISELPVMNLRTGEIKNSQAGDTDSIAKLVITTRLMRGNSVVGYMVKDASGKQYRLSKEKVWQLAREKAISNAMAQVSGQQKILRGVGIELRDLPAIQI